MKFLPALTVSQASISKVPPSSKHLHKAEKQGKVDVTAIYKGPLLTALGSTTDISGTHGAPNFHMPNEEEEAADPLRTPVP